MVMEKLVSLGMRSQDRDELRAHVLANLEDSKAHNARAEGSQGAEEARGAEAVSVRRLPPDPVPGDPVDDLRDRRRCSWRRSSRRGNGRPRSSRRTSAGSCRRTRTRERAVPGQVLSGGDAVHHLRHRDGVPLSRGPSRTTSSRSSGLIEMGVFIAILLARVRVRMEARRARMGGVSDVDRSELRHRSARQARQLGPQVLAVARDLRSRLLRDRDDGDDDAAPRPRAVRDGGLPRLRPVRPT